MNLQKYNIQELERFIEEIQKKILVFNENLKDRNLTEKETILIKEQLLNHKNLMSECQIILHGKYSEGNKEFDKQK